MPVPYYEKWLQGKRRVYTYGGIKTITPAESAYIVIYSEST
jgi:hypothetical protein